MFNVRDLEETGFTLPDPKYLYKQTIQVIGSYRLNIVKGSTLFSVENHSENIIMKINGQSTFIERHQVRVLNKPINEHDIMFEHANAYITVTILSLA